MKSIINVWRSSICWRGLSELITDVRKPEIMVKWRHCRRRAIYWLLRSPRKLVTLNPNSNQQAPDATSFLFSPVGGMPTARSHSRKTLLSEKSGRCGIAADYDGATLAIDRGDIRQAIDRCSNIWASLPGAGYTLLEHNTAWLQNSKKRAERSERLMCMSRVTAIISALLSASSSGPLQPLIITVITPLPTKLSDKNARELKLANAAITDMQMRQRMLPRRCNILPGVSWC